MSTPVNALVGYAILRANYNAEAPSYLDNFSSFALAAIAGADSNVVERNTVGRLVRETFGLNVPALVVPRLLKRTHKQGLTEPIGTDSVRLTAKGQAEIPDLTSEVAQYKQRQTELVNQFAIFVENNFPEHLELTTKDLGRHLAEFFDKHAVLLLGNSLGQNVELAKTDAGVEFAVSAFVTHLSGHDHVRFSYVVEAAKGAMLASVLELDTSCMNESLASLTLVFDTPVVMDILGYHGEAPQSAMLSVVNMAKAQGGRLGVFRHSVSELEGILDSVESALRRGSSSRSTGAGYLHFAETGASPVDIAELKNQLEETLASAGLQILEKPGEYYEYGLDESKLEAKIQSRVRYLQDAARVNDVTSLSAVHRLRRGNRSQTLERSVAVMVSANTNLVRGARDFREDSSFPLAITAEATASILWVRSPAVADAVPRDMVLASAYVGMQPSPTLWKKYIDEVERLEGLGSVSPDDAVLLRATRVGREAFMVETLGDESTLSQELPLIILEKVHNGIKAPLTEKNASLEERIGKLQDQSMQLTETYLNEKDARSATEEENAHYREELDALQATVEMLKRNDLDRVSAIQNQAERTSTVAVNVLWLLVDSLAIFFAFALVFNYTNSSELKLFSTPWMLATITILAALIPTIIWVRKLSRSMQAPLQTWLARRRLLKAGHPVSDSLSTSLHPSERVTSGAAE